MAGEVIAPYYQSECATLYCCDVMVGLRQIPSESIHCAVSSIPYWGLRSYPIPPVVWDGDPLCEHSFGAEARRGGPAGAQGSTSQRKGRSNVEAQQRREDALGSFCERCGGWRGQLGLEAEWSDYLRHVLQVFGELHRVLRKDATLWLNHGDSYACSPNGRAAEDTKTAGNDDRTYRDKPISTEKGPGLEGTAQIGGVKREKCFKGFRSEKYFQQSGGPAVWQPSPTGGGFQAKQQILQPHRIAIALQEAGWFVRCDCVWAKASPMPCSASDRPGLAHEYVFLLSKSPRYYFDWFGVRVPAVSTHGSGNGYKREPRLVAGGRGNDTPWQPQGYRNLRSVWTFPHAGEGGRSGHYASYPIGLPSLAIRAGSSEAVCASCGAPYRRLVQKTGGSIGHDYENADGSALEAGMSRYRSRIGDAVDGSGHSYEVRHLGWRKSCRCATDERTPATILDCFAGTGTSLVAALSLGRKAVGIELAPKYCAIAKKGLLETTPPLPFDLEEDARQAATRNTPPPPAQMTLFDEEELTCEPSDLSDEALLLLAKTQKAEERECTPDSCSAT